MKYRALVSFTGLVSMSKDEVREISDLSLANDLLNAGYIEEVKEKTSGTDVPKKETETSKPKKTRSPKRKESKK